MSDRKLVLAARALIGRVIAVSFALIAVGTASLLGQNTAGDSDSGTFLILANNKRLGTEKFQIKRGATGWDATAELQIEGDKGAKTSETATFHLDSALRPAKYTREQRAPVAGNLAVVFMPEETQLAAMVAGGEPQQEEFVLPLENLAVLDTNFFHHYALLLRLYDSAKGGAQPFNVFVPQEALPGTITLKFIAKESVPVGQTTKELDHFQAVTEELQIEIWATPERAIQRISIPAATLEVVRQ
jgi:hypothetical protein